MAKGKHSAALFEVIKKGSNPDRAGQSLRTPIWWFKSRPAATAPVEATTYTPAEPSASAQATMAPARSAPRAASLASSTSRSSAVHMDFDRGRKEITLRLRYTTALVTTFGVCAVIGMAYVIGRHLNRGPQTAAATATQVVPQYVRQSPQPGVTDVPRHQSRTQSSNTAPPRPINQTPASPAPREPGPRSLVPAGAETRLPRSINLNYVVIHAYPQEERDTARTMCEFLTKNGIPCTLESIDYAPNWICLVGTAGFTRISSNDYRAYVDNIIALGKQLPTSRFDRIDPHAYKWKAPSGS